MKKSMNNRFFFPFLLLIGMSLAVLGFGIGQLFPYFVDHYTEAKNEQSIRALDEAIEKLDIQLSETNQQQLITAVTSDVEDETKKELKGKLLIVLIIFLVITFSVLSYFANRLLSNLVEPIENVTKTAQELSIGNYQARAFATGPRTITNLRNSINMLASNLQEITKKRAVEEERLHTLIENMGSALLMIDRAGETLIVNQTFLQRFNYLYDDVIGKNFMMLEVPDELKKFIDHVFLTELPYRKQIQMTVDQEIIHKMAYGAPVVGEHGKWHGVVVVLHDITELIRLEHIRKDFVANVS
ncbi:MAG: PAS domain-containing protein, partial [Lysinibacillus sp.]